MTRDIKVLRYFACLQLEMVCMSYVFRLGFDEGLDDWEAAWVLGEVGMFRICLLRWRTLLLRGFGGV